MKPASLSRVTLLIALVASLAAAVACDDSPTSPSIQNPPYNQTDLTVGTGATAASGNTVTVEYSGWLYDPTKPDQKGPLFDTSTGRGPFVFVLGVGYVIPGWEQGVPGMKVGGTRRLVVPPSLAYGSSRVSAIPPWSTLVFEIELLEVQ